MKCFIYFSSSFRGERPVKERKKDVLPLIKSTELHHIFDFDCAELSAEFANSFSDTTQSIRTGTQTPRPSMFPGLN